MRSNDPYRDSWLPTLIVRTHHVRLLPLSRKGARWFGEAPRFSRSRARRIRKRRTKKKSKRSLSEWIYRKIRKINPHGITPHIAVRSPLIRRDCTLWKLPSGPNAVRRMRAEKELPRGFLVGKTLQNKRFFYITKRGRFWTIAGTDCPQRAFKKNFYRLGGSGKHKAKLLRAISHQIARYGLDFKGLSRLFYLYSGITARKLLGFYRKLPKVCMEFFSRRSGHASY